MRVVTFSADLYSGFAIDEAVKAYARVATFNLKKDGETYRVEIAADGRFDEERVALEFQNFALGASIERLKQGSSDAPGGQTETIHERAAVAEIEREPK